MTDIAPIRYAFARVWWNQIGPAALEVRHMTAAEWCQADDALSQATFGEQRWLMLGTAREFAERAPEDDSEIAERRPEEKEA